MVSFVLATWLGFGAANSSSSTPAELTWLLEPLGVRTFAGTFFERAPTLIRGSIAGGGCEAFARHHAALDLLPEELFQLVGVQQPAAEVSFPPPTCVHTPLVEGTGTQPELQILKGICVLCFFCVHEVLRSGRLPGATGSAVSR